MNHSDESDPQLHLEIKGPPGAELGAARRRRGLTLEDVARELKLSHNTLQQLEADQAEHLAPAFWRGYIVSYARLLDVDPEPLLANVAPAEAGPLREVLPVRRAGHRIERVMRFATYVLVTTVIVPPLVYFFVERGVDWFEPVGEPPAGRSDPQAEAVSSQVEPTRVQRNETLAASALPLTSLSRNPGVESTEALDSAPMSTEDEPLDPRSVLALELASDSWVEIEDAEGERLEFDLLRAGQSRLYRGMPPFELLIGRGNAVRLELDGSPVSFQGNDTDGVARFEIGSPTLADPSDAG